MDQDQLIRIDTFCIHHHIDETFIHSLQNSGLIEVIRVEGSEFLSADELNELEKLARLHYEMDINIEGVETICHLLKKLDDMQKDIRLLRNRLSLYEPPV